MTVPFVVDGWRASRLDTLFGLAGFANVVFCEGEQIVWYLNSLMPQPQAKGPMRAFSGLSCAQVHFEA